MTSTPRKFVSRPLVVVAGAMATVLTIILGLLQIGNWINENAVWTLWAAIVVLIVAIVLLIARLAAVTEFAKVAEQTAAAETQSAKAATHAAGLAGGELIDVQPAGSPTPRAALTKIDRSLAEQLFRYASDLELLTTLGSFDSYQIPRGPVRLIDELRTAPDANGARRATGAAPRRASGDRPKLAHKILAGSFN